MRRQNLLVAAWSGQTECVQWCIESIRLLGVIVVDALRVSRRQIDVNAFRLHGIA